jgi:AP-2 complex subunit mu-1
MQIRFNDNTGIDKDKEDKKAVDIDDCTFHRCVAFGKFDAGPYSLPFNSSRWRIRTGCDTAFLDNINLPFVSFQPQEEQNMTKVSINVKVIANFGSTLPRMWS